MTGARRLEELVALLLRNGTWLASAIIGLGFTLALVDTNLDPEMRIATWGIALFILLPSIRVLLMLFVFLRQRDFRYALIAGIVLLMILLGVIVGFAAKHGGAG